MHAAESLSSNWHHEAKHTHCSTFKSSLVCVHKHPLQGLPCLYRVSVPLQLLDFLLKVQLILFFQGNLVGLIDLQWCEFQPICLIDQSCHTYHASAIYVKLGDGSRSAYLRHHYSVMISGSFELVEDLQLVYILVMISSTAETQKIEQSLAISQVPLTLVSLTTSALYVIPDCDFGVIK